MHLRIYFHRKYTCSIHNICSIYINHSICINHSSHSSYSIHSIHSIIHFLIRHLNSLTARLNHLTALIEDPDVDQGQRLLALKEVAEEARAYKMGGEDKIRVALNTAETIISHTDYIDALDSQLDRFGEISTLLNPTKHLKLDQYYVPGQLKDRRAKRRQHY